MGATRFRTWGLAAALGLIAAAGGCRQPEVQYEYIYTQAAPVAVAASGSPNALGLPGSPVKGASAPKVVLVESSDFQ